MKLRYDSTNPRKTENLSHDFFFLVRNFHPVFGGNSQTGKSCRKPLDKSKRGNYNDLTIKLTQTKREVRDKMSLQHCLVLTVATGAVWMDLRTRRIANEWIITAWIAGLVTQLIRYGAAGAGIFLFWDAFPDTRTLHSVLFSYAGSGRYQTPFRCWRLSRRTGDPEMYDCVVPVWSGLIYRNYSRLRKLTAASYQIFSIISKLILPKENTRKKTEPVPYYDGKWGHGVHPFFRSRADGSAALDWGFY